MYIGIENYLSFNYVGVNIFNILTKENVNWKKNSIK